MWLQCLQTVVWSTCRSSPGLRLAGLLLPLKHCPVSHPFLAPPFPPSLCSGEVARLGTLFAGVVATLQQPLLNDINIKCSGAGGQPQLHRCRDQAERQFAAWAGGPAAAAPDMQALLAHVNQVEVRGLLRGSTPRADAGSLLPPAELPSGCWGGCSLLLLRRLLACWLCCKAGVEGGML